MGLEDIGEEATWIRKSAKVNPKMAIAGATALGASAAIYEIKKPRSSARNGLRPKTNSSRGGIAYLD